MTHAEFATNSDLLITGFLLLIIDRMAVLHVASQKARRVLEKKVKFSTPQTVQIRVLRALQSGYGLVQGMIFLFSFWVLCMIQVVNPEVIHDDVGKVVFASIGFLVSVGCSIINSMIEDLDRRL